MLIIGACTPKIISKLLYGIKAYYKTIFSIKKMLIGSIPNKHDFFLCKVKKDFRKSVIFS